MRSTGILSIAIRFAAQWCVVPVLALAVALPGAARAQQPYFELIPSASIAAAGLPFSVDVHLIGTLVEYGLQVAATSSNDFVEFTLSVDGAVQTKFLLGGYELLPDQVSIAWRQPTGWQASGITLSAGVHTILAQYGGDTFNPAMSTSLSMTVLQPVTLAGGKNGALTAFFGVLPGVLPGGLLTLKDITSGDVTNLDIADFLVVDPFDQSLHLDLGRLKGDTLISYPGDQNYAPLDFTYDVQNVPAPAGVLPFALAALAALRRRVARQPRRFGCGQHSC